jgi:hypothetical protein
MTAYHADARATQLSALRARLESTDLIPSQVPLLDGLKELFDALERHGIHNVADLQAALKTAKARDVVAKATGVDPSKLNLLRRTVAGFFPKPRALREIDWVDQDAIAALAQAGIRNTRDLFEADTGTLEAICGADHKILGLLYNVADLCRIQWVSPSFARALISAGYGDSASVAAADPEALRDALDVVHRDTDFYGHKIGLRDIRRLCAAAGYVP